MTMRSPLSRAGGGAAMSVVAMTSIQLGLALSVQQFGQLGPLGTAWLRVAWAGVLLLVLVRPRRADFTRRGFTACVGLGVVTTGMMVLFMSAVARIPLGTAAALEFLGPLAVSMLGGRVRGRWVWTGLAGAGVVLLTEPWHGGNDPVGIACALGAAGCWAAYILLTQRVGDEVAGLKGLAVSMPVAGLLATVLVAPSAADDLTWPLVGTGLALALLAPLIPFSLELLALRRLTTTAFGTLMSLEPALAVVVGVVALGQVPGAGPAVGVAFVIAAGVGAVRNGAREAEPAPARAEERERVGALSQGGGTVGH